MTIQIARCPEHGLHGERDECFVCGGPVEQVEMIEAKPADIFLTLYRDSFHDGIPAEDIQGAENALARARSSRDQTQSLWTGVASVTTDPRSLGGGISGPGGPHDEGQFVIDTSNALLLDYHTVVRVDTDDPDDLVVALLLEGRINRLTDRAKVLVLTNEDGVAAFISELLALLGRAGGPFQQRLGDRLQALRDEGLDRPDEGAGA